VAGSPGRVIPSPGSLASISKSSYKKVSLLKQLSREGADTPKSLSAAMRRWLANGASQGHPTSQGGPWRRKRTQRRLGILIEETQQEPSPIAATTHVKVIEVPDSPDDIEGQMLVKAKAPIAEFVL
jgi:hypothetical protein